MLRFHHWSVRLSARCVSTPGHVKEADMTEAFDAIVVGGGLGGLVAGGLLAKSGVKTLLVERNQSVGGAASTFRVGELIVETSLQATSDPTSPSDPKHQPLRDLGVLDAVEWVRAGSLYEVRGGPVGEPLLLPDSFDGAREALTSRFPRQARGIREVLGSMRRLSGSLVELNQIRTTAVGLSSLSMPTKIGALVPDWGRNLQEVLKHHLGQDEAVKFGLAANLFHCHDDPARLWWVYFAAMQGSYLRTGLCYVRGGSQRLSNALAKSFRAAGGTLLTGRAATKILLGDDGRPRAVVHEDAEGGDPAVIAARLVVANAAPDVVAAMLPATARKRFLAPMAKQERSASLFSLTLGLDVRPAELGLHSYSTMLLPDWMERLEQFREAGRLLAAAPGLALPPMALVDYSAIDSGMGGPPYPVAVAGIDRAWNWAGLDGTAYADRRDAWRDAIIAVLDITFPGLASHMVASTFNTGRSYAHFLNSPDGSVYGFAPLPPSGPIWNGVDRSPVTAIPGLFLASAYAGAGGYTGVIAASAYAAELCLAAVTT
jgi:phytoene dehydrogenase-like protein